MILMNLLTTQKAENIVLLQCSLEAVLRKAINKVIILFGPQLEVWPGRAKVIPQMLCCTVHSCPNCLVGNFVRNMFSFNAKHTRGEER